MDSEKLRNRKYPTARALAEGERDVLPSLYEGGSTVKQLAEMYNTTSPTIVKALVYLGFEGPSWAVDSVKRALEKTDVKPSTMKRTNKPLI